MRASVGRVRYDVGDVHKSCQDWVITAEEYATNTALGSRLIFLNHGCPLPVLCVPCRTIAFVRHSFLVIGLIWYMCLSIAWPKN